MPAFSVSSFTLIKRLFSSSLLSSIGLVSWYFIILLFLFIILFIYILFIILLLFIYYYFILFIPIKVVKNIRKYVKS